MSEGHDIRKFCDFAQSVTKFGGNSLPIDNQNCHEIYENPVVWKRSLEWSVQTICSVPTINSGTDFNDNSNNETILRAKSTVAVACGLLRKPPTHESNYFEEEGITSWVMWSVSLLLLLLSKDSNDNHDFKMIESFLSRLVSHYCSQCRTQQDQVLAAVLLSNNMHLLHQLRILTLMAQDWNPSNLTTTCIAISRSWLQLSVYPILSTSLFASISYLRTVPNHDNCNDSLVNVHNKSSHEFELGIQSVNCYTAWLQCQNTYESPSTHPMNLDKSSSVDATMIPTLISQIAQECLRIASSRTLDSNSTCDQEFSSKMSKFLFILLESFLEEISFMDMSIYQTHINTMLSSLVMDTYYALSPKISHSHNNSQLGQPFELKDLYNTMVEFAVTLAIAILEKNDNNGVRKQQNFEFIDIFLWGISHPDLLETVTIPAVDILPQALQHYYEKGDILIQLENCIRVIVHKQIFILKEEMKNEHMEYFLESSKDAITAISSNQQQKVLNFLKKELLYHINNVDERNSRGNNNYNTWGVLVCIDFITQIISSNSIEIFYDNDDTRIRNNQQHNISQSWKSLVQACEPFVKMLDNSIGFAMANLIQHFGPFFFMNHARSTCDFSECQKRNIEIEKSQHKMNLLRYFHELLYQFVLASRTNEKNSISENDGSTQLLLGKFCGAIKEISKSCNDSKFYKLQYNWESGDTLHPFNAVVEIIAEYIFCLEQNYSPIDRTCRESSDGYEIIHHKHLLLLVYTATNYAVNAFVKEGTINSSENTLQLLCVRCFLPLMHHYNNDIYENRGSYYNVNILLEIFRAISQSKMTSNSVNASISTLFQSLEHPLNQAFFQLNRNFSSQHLSARATLALLVAQCCCRTIKNHNSTVDLIKEDSEVVTYKNVFSRCLHIVNDSMNSIIKNNDGIVLSHFVEALKNSIETIYSTNDVEKVDNPLTLSENHKMTFLLILDKIFDLVTHILKESDVSKEIIREDEDSWRISLVESCLLAGRATLRTEIIVHRPQTFTKLTHLCVHIFGFSTTWQQSNFDKEERLCKASLDCLKWSFWCCRSYDKNEKQHEEIFTCMRMAFGDNEIIQRILYIVCSKSLGFTSNDAFHEEVPIKKRSLSCGKLQRYFTTCLHTLLFGDEKSIHQDLVQVFRQNSACLKNAIDDCMGRKGDVALVNWIYQGIVSSNTGIQSLRRFIVSARKVLNGIEGLKHENLKLGDGVNHT